MSNLQNKKTENAINDRNLSLWLKIFIALQIIIIFGFFNPWSDIFQEAAGIVFFVELMMFFFWAIPVFLYHLLIKKRKISECFSLAIYSILEGMATFT